MLHVMWGGGGGWFEGVGVMRCGVLGGVVQAVLCGMWCVVMFIPVYLYSIRFNDCT